MAAPTRRTVALGVLATTVVLAVSIDGRSRASVQVPFRLDSASARWTAVSGVGTTYREMLVSSREKSVFRLHFGFAPDRPGSAVVEVMAYDQFLRPVEPGGRYHEEYRTGALRLSEPAAWVPVPPAVEGFIYRLQVCLDSARAKLEGVRIWGKRIEPDGHLVPTNQSSFQHAECRFWVAGAACSNDKLSSGVRAYYSGSGTNGFTGLALRCETVVPNSEAALR
jgi:hypothetical protein